jgi:peptidoglycan-N-acetylmuramic acid deacetylase
MHGSTFVARSSPMAPILRATLVALMLALLAQAPASASGAKVVTQGPSGSTGVALTFDDGWSATSCERIAKTLRDTGATATFFINGTHLRAEPKRWRRILEGFPVANHTRSHPWLTRLPDSKVKGQIRTNAWIHHSVLGRPMLKLLRPPFGAYDDRVRTIARELRYRKIVLWSRSAADSSSKATVTSIIRRTTGAPPGSIILMHCGPSATADALPAIIRYYQRRGIKLVGLDEMFGFSKAKYR